MKQIWVPYWEWEDWKAGMWRRVDDEESYLKLAIEFTGDHNRYGSAMNEVIMEWPRTMINSLTNKSINRRAFVGHCAVQYKINCPEYITRMAWKRLTNQQRVFADLEAERAIKKWETQYKNTLVHGQKDAIKIYQTSHQERLII